MQGKGKEKEGKGDILLFGTQASIVLDLNQPIPMVPDIDVAVISAVADRDFLNQIAFVIIQIIVTRIGRVSISVSDDIIEGHAEKLALPVLNFRAVAVGIRKTKGTFYFVSKK
jgi:hypothetical protein